ncbi:MAG: amidohydrolase [Acidimicrobiia bacterium]|nr:amidohydrolase [Acidimicrobiia bacterium]
MVDIRRTLHRRPELAFEEKETAETLIRELESLSIPYSYAGPGSGVVGRLTAGPDRPTVALRADMDALPVVETTGLPFASTIEGNMHACGHDAHMAMVIGAAHLLAESPPDVNVRFVFQPAEERGGGARTVLASGLLDDVDAIFAAHVTHHYLAGEVMVAAGTITAQSDRFTIRVTGRGGHGARPHEAVDAIVITGLLIGAIQTLVSREIDPTHPSVVTIGRIEAGTAANVIAETAVLEGSIRSTRADVRELLHDGIRRMAAAFGQLYAADLDVEIQQGYPPVVNTPTEAELAHRAVRAILGEPSLRQLDHPSMGAEDFSYYLQRIPGCYMRFGARPPDSEYIPLHSPAFDIDEAVLRVGAAVFDKIVRMAPEVYPTRSTG